MATINDQFKKIFYAAQESTSNHGKCLQKLKTIYTQCDNKEFFDELLWCIKNYLILDYTIRNHYQEKVVQFVSSFLKSLQESYLNEGNEDDNPVLVNVIETLLTYTQCENKNFRFNTCYFLKSILLSLTGLDLGAVLCEKVQECMLEATNDTLVGVRVNAVYALAPFQDPRNDHCPIISGLNELRGCDPNARIRKVCVEKLALCKSITPSLVESARDVDPSVRLAVYKRAEKFPMSFKISQKQVLIETAFSDLNTEIVNYVSTSLIPTWFEHFNSSYLDLLSRIRLDSDWKHLETTMNVSQLILKSLFSLRPREEILNVLPLDEKKLLKLDSLDWESSVFWRILAEHLVNSTRKNDFDEFFPELLHLLNYVKQITSLGEQKFEDDPLLFQYILLQLFKIIKLYDYADVVCKRYLQELCHDLLSSNTLDEIVLEAIIEALIVAVASNQKIVAFICEICSGIVFGSNDDDEEQLEVEEISAADNYEIAQIKVKIHELRESLEQAVTIQNFDLAKELKSSVQEETEKLGQLEEKLKRPVQKPVNQDIKDIDHRIIIRSLKIMHCLLKQGTINDYYPVLRTFKQNVIDELLHHSNSTVVIYALKCLSLCCLMDKHTAHMNIGIFCKILKLHHNVATCDSSLVIAAIGAVADMLTCFGVSLLASPTADEDVANDSFNEEEQEILSGGFSLSDIVNALLSFLNDEDVDIQETATRGICLLIRAERVQSRTIMSRMILKYVSPASSEPESQSLVQIIGVTLGELCKFVENSAQFLLNAVAPTINIIVNAPRKSPLAAVDIDRTYKLMIGLLSCYKQGLQLQVRLAIILLNEIHSKPNKTSNIVFAKMLLALNISEAAQDSCETMLTLCNELDEMPISSKVAAPIQKFKSALELRNKTLAEKPLEE